MDHNDVKIILFDILNGLKYLHNKNIMHRDIKPSNILIDINGRCVLADFGLARIISRPVSRNMITWWYRPLEVLHGSDKYN